MDPVLLRTLLVFALPFVTFWFLLLFGRVMNKYRGYTATAIMLVTLILSVLNFIDVWSSGSHQMALTWFEVGDTVIDFSISVDKITALMMLVITLVSFLVHLFSIEYLRGDRNFEKYFAYLGLFTFSMLGIVVSSNLLFVFIFWELVGLSSYLLIGFWHRKPEAAMASKKAFIANRIADAGFIVALLSVWAMFGSFDINVIQSLVQDADSGLMILAGFGIMCGGLGKSAQFPFTVWLPDAMEGPTPVSALIHAATMVAAGVYLLVRFSFLMPVEIMDAIVAIGTVTAFIAAYSAITQNDIKKVLAYSTISQLGYMFMAIGVGAWDAAMFHLLTHAFFKACLFLSAGAVIHSMHQLDEECKKKGIESGFDHQDMTYMGGLRKHMPVTFLTFALSAMALAGLPLFSGFLSKDAILSSTMNWAECGEGYLWIVPVMGLITAFLTAAYMTRQVYLIFFGKFRLPIKKQEFKGNESAIIETPWLMRIPVIILAVLSIAFVYSINPVSLHDVWFFVGMRGVEHLEYEGIGIISAVISAAGLLLSVIYYRRFQGRQQFFTSRSIFYRLSRNHFYLDQLFHWIVGKLSEVVAGLIHLFDRKFIDSIVNNTGRYTNVFAHVIGWFDKFFIDGAVNLFASVANASGNVLKSMGRGEIQMYLIWAGIGLAILIWWIL